MLATLMYLDSPKSQTSLPSRCQMLLFCCLAHVAPCVGGDGFKLEIRETNHPVSFRGIAISSDRTVWVGGSGATLLKSADQGSTWIPQELEVPQTSDFRDVEEPLPGRLVAMSAGKGADSRVVFTKDGGQTWRCVLENPDTNGFFNGMAFTKSGFGALVGDPVDGLLTVFVTNNGGLDWKRIPGPKVTRDEYGFAASGTGVVVDASHRIGIVTGGSRCRYYSRSADSDEWSEFELGMRHGAASAGAFSIAFAGGVGVVVGGDYLKPTLADRNVAVTRNQGRTWSVPKNTLPHKACVISLGGDQFLTCGRTGIAFTADGGASWKELSSESFYCMTLASEPVSTSRIREIWLAGADGRIAIMQLGTRQHGFPTSTTGGSLPSP